MTPSAAPGRGSTLRHLLDGDTLVRAVGAHNGLTARLAERAGFEAVWASGLEVSASYALPDASLLSMTQFLDAADAMQTAIAIPVIADCDTGFGGPLNVAHTVRSYERRGIAGICVEDKVFPKINSFAHAHHALVPIEDFTAKIKAGKAEQASDDFLFIARTEALVAGLGMDEALGRARAYADAGADAILVHSVSRSPAQILSVAAAWDRDVPLVTVPTTYSSVHERQLAAAGFKLVIYANHGLRAAITGVSATLAALAEHGSGAAVEPQIATMSEVFELQGSAWTYEIH
jgi:phosphoenolpyruvate phosphomutase